MSENILPLNEAAKLPGKHFVTTDKGLLCVDGMIASPRDGREGAKIEFTPVGETLTPFTSTRFAVLPDGGDFDVPSILKEPEAATVPVYEVKVPKVLSWLGFLTDYGSLCGVTFALFAITIASAVLGATLFPSLNRLPGNPERHIGIYTVFEEEFEKQNERERNDDPEVRRRVDQLFDRAQEFTK